MRDCASGLSLHPADQVQVARQPKVGDLGAEAMRVAGRRCQQDVACITASQVGAAVSLRIRLPVKLLVCRALHVNCASLRDKAQHHKSGLLMKHMEY